MKKILTVICIALLCCMVFTACSAPVSFQTSGASYEVKSITTSEQSLGITSTDGNTMLTITLGASDKSLDDAQASFFPAGGTPSYVTDAGAQYPCKEMAIQSNGAQVQVVLVYEVPTDWSSGKEFSLGGNNFSPVALKK